jgi:hypothetical protein
MWTEALTVKNNYDTIVSTLAAQDPVPWYQKPNLRRLYATFVVSVLCVEVSLKGTVSPDSGGSLMVRCVRQRPVMTVPC